MPFPLIPVIIGGVSAIAGLFGVKKGLDAKEDFAEAERVQSDAEEILAKADRRLEAARKSAEARLETLGKTKVAVFEASYPSFRKAMEGLKNFESDGVAGENPVTIENRLQQLDAYSVTIGELATGLASASASGALTAFAAFGGTQMLAAASTGTAISTLSGAAATNATLAWLGGGSLAAGGGGMAMGTAVLGGVVAGPALAIGGVLLAMKAETALADARSNRRKAQAIAAEKEVAEKATGAIDAAAASVTDLLRKLGDLSAGLNVRLLDIRAVKDDYRLFTAAEKAALANAILCVQGIVDLTRSPLIKEDGALDAAIVDVQDKARELVERLESVR